MNLINEETGWEHFSHSLVSCLCCPLFPPSLPVPLFLLHPQKQLCPCHTHKLSHWWGGKTKTGRWKIPRPWLLLSSDNLTNILSVWQWVLSDCLRKQGSHDYTVCLSSSSSLTSCPFGGRGMGYLWRETKGNTRSKWLLPGAQGTSSVRKTIFKKCVFWFEGLTGIKATTEGFMNPAGKWMEKLCASSSPHLLTST